MFAIASKAKAYKSGRHTDTFSLILPGKAVQYNKKLEGKTLQLILPEWVIKKVYNLGIKEEVRKASRNF